MANHGDRTIKNLSTINLPTCNMEEKENIAPFTSDNKHQNQELNFVSLDNTLNNNVVLDIPEVTEKVFRVSSLPEAEPFSCNYKNDLIIYYNEDQNCDLAISNVLPENTEEITESDYISQLDNALITVDQVENFVVLNYEQEKTTDVTEVDRNNVNLVDTDEDLNYVPSASLEPSPEELNLTKRRKRQFVNSGDWVQNKKQCNREKGLPYLGRRMVDGKWKYDIQKEERKLKGPCNCKLSMRNNPLLKCRELTREDRQAIFEKFWTKMTWSERHLYVALLIDTKSVARPRNRTTENSSRRTESLVYHLKKGDKRLRVCKTMFLNTHCLKENAVLEWLKKQNKTNLLKNPSTKEDTQPQGTRYKDMKQVLRTFFKELPKMESHYCRSSSTKLYLEPLWKSKSALYAFYKEWCTEKDYAFLSSASFDYVFAEMNLSLYRPKKDECDQCVSFRTGNLSEDAYHIHQEKKREAREEKNKDKVSENKVFCMDLQSVLLSPKSNTSSLYFKQKLIVHNFTFFDLKSKNGYCYLWHESAGGVAANDYASVICSFIKNHVFSSTKEGQTVILYSDGCTSQNRNFVLANALINLAITLNITIEQKFLEKGHTQMEADSIHSTIERKLRHTNINVPADYINICLQARKKFPYKVYYLDYTFFKNFQKLTFLKSIRPGKRIGDPIVTDIRALRYTSDSSVFYKLRHPEEFCELQYSRKSKEDRKNIACEFENLPVLYKGPIPIKNEKWNHLQLLKCSIEKDFHSFYDTLPHQFC